jgi:hypothetical protein
VKRDNCRLNSRAFFKFLPALLLGVFSGYCQGAVVDDSGMISTQTGKCMERLGRHRPVDSNCISNVVDRKVRE